MYLHLELFLIQDVLCFMCQKSRLFFQLISRFISQTVSPKHKLMYLDSFSCPTNSPKRSLLPLKTQENYEIWEVGTCDFLQINLLSVELW